MDFLDLYYRAFKDLSETASKEKNNEKVLKAIRQASEDKDSIEAKRTKCIIEKDWIEAIEKGLPFIGNAIEEQRQFIANEGNVVPIEKVRRVSKASTVHLAKHSNLITHLPENENDDLIPDKLFMEEKLSDFAVYENKFLYFLLSFLRDFVNVRAEKIAELGSSFSSDFRINKNVNLSKRRISCEIKFQEENKSYYENSADEETGNLIGRIEDIQQNISSLLATELIQSVSKVAMIKPPIVKTNVLKMDANFKKTVELYEFVSEYEKDGYRIEEIKNVINPFTDEPSEDVANIVNAISFLCYAYGGDLISSVKKRYEEEEARRAAEKEAAEKLALERLKNNLNKTGKELTEYALLLEKRNKKLQADSDELKLSLAREKQLEQNIANLNGQNAEMRISISNLKNNGEALEARLERSETEHKTQIDKLNSEHSARLMERETELNKKFEQLKTELSAENSALNEEKTMLSARLHGLLTEKGGVATEDIDYTSKEHFLQLENEYRAFTKFFDGKWKEVKKRIRINRLAKELIGENGSDKEKGKKK